MDIADVVAGALEAPEIGKGRTACLGGIGTGADAPGDVSLEMVAEFVIEFCLDRAPPEDGSQELREPMPHDATLKLDR